MLNYSATCLTEDVCDTRYSLSCINQTSNLSNCSCLKSKYYNGSECRDLLAYQSSCTNSIQCDSNLGLICSSLSCICNSTQYYNGSICGKKMIIIKFLSLYSPIFLKISVSMNFSFIERELSPASSAERLAGNMF